MPRSGSSKGGRRAHLRVLPLLGLAGAAFLSAGCSSGLLRPRVISAKPRAVYIDVEQYLAMHPAYGLLPPLQRGSQGGAAPEVGDRAMAVPAPVQPQPFDDLPPGTRSPAASPADLAAAQQVLRAEYRVRRRLASEDPFGAESARPDEAPPLVRRPPPAHADPAPAEDAEDVSQEIAAARAFELESRRIQEQIRELDRRLTGGGLITAAEATALRTRLVQRQLELRSLAGPVLTRVPVGPAESRQATEVRRIPIERLRHALSPPRRSSQAVSRPDASVQRKIRRQARRAEADERAELRLTALREEEEQRIARITHPEPLEPIRFSLAPRALIEAQAGDRMEMAAAVRAAGRGARSLPAAGTRAAAVHPDRDSLLAELRSIASSEARKLGWKAVFEPGKHPDATSDLRPRVLQSFGFWRGSGPPARSAR